MAPYDQLSPLMDVPFNKSPKEFVKDILSAEESLYLETSAIDGEYHRIVSDDIWEMVTGKYIADIDGTEFRFFFNKGDTDYLHVFLNPSEKKDRFVRWRWNPQGMNLVIADPMVTEFDLSLGWFFGTQEEDYRVKTAKLIQAISKKYSIPPEKTIIYGNSGGGTAAVYVSALIPGSTSVSLNPQIWLETRMGSLKRLEEAIGKSIGSSEIKDRNNMAKTISDGKSTHLIISNAMSSEDAPQIKKLCDILGFQPKYGISSKDNLYVWIHKCYPCLNEKGDWDSHRASDYKELFLTIDEVAKRLKEPGTERLVAMVNELWAERSLQLHNYLCMKTILDSETDPMAKYRLSQMYREGDNVPTDIGKSVECLIDILDKVPEAERTLFYTHIRHYPQSRKTVEDYTLNHPNSRYEYYIGTAYSEMSWDEELGRKGEEWLLRSLRPGNKEYRLKTFDTLWNSKTRGNEQHLPAIVEDFSEDDAEFALRLGKTCLKGRGCGKNIEKADRNITFAYNNKVKGSDIAMFDLYLETRDHDDLMEGLLKKGVSEKDPEAIGRMGLLHFYGICRPVSYWKAKRYLDEAMGIKRLPWLFAYQRKIRESKKRSQ